MAYRLRRGLGDFQSSELAAGCTADKPFSYGYTANPAAPWNLGGMWVAGWADTPVGPVQPGGVQPPTVYPILLDSSCNPYPDTSRPTQNPMVGSQAAAVTADAQLIANTAAGISTATPTPANQIQAAPISSTNIITPQGAAIVNSSGAASPSDGSSAPASTDWFTESMFGGIPNWSLLAAAAVAAFFVMKGGK